MDEVVSVDVTWHPECFRIYCLFLPFSGHLDPFAIRRRRARRRRRSCQRRGSTALSRCALDEGMPFKLATHMVADLDELSHMKTPRSLAALGRTYEFDPPQRPDKGPFVPRDLISLHHGEESPDTAFRRSNVRSMLREVFV